MPSQINSWLSKHWNISYTSKSILSSPKFSRRSETGNGCVHKYGGTNRSGENHAQGIGITSVTYNTPIPKHNHASFLGVKPDNHRVTAFIESLVKGKVLLVSQNVCNQDVYSLAPRIKIFLNHEILHIHSSYIKKLVEGHWQWMVRRWKRLGRRTLWRRDWRGFSVDNFRSPYLTIPNL